MNIYVPIHTCIPASYTWVYHTQYRQHSTNLGNSPPSSEFLEHVKEPIAKQISPLSSSFFIMVCGVCFEKIFSVSGSFCSYYHRIPTLLFAYSMCYNISDLSTSTYPRMNNRRNEIKLTTRIGCMVIITL